MCTLTEAEGAQPGASEKYDAMLLDLAARAEIRDNMSGGAGVDNNAIMAGGAGGPREEWTC
jgi:hypothetical protein